MQAVTIAIGKAGIAKFTNRYLGTVITKALAQLRPPSQLVKIPDFKRVYVGGETFWSNISINLSNGTLPGLKPIFSKAEQKPGGTFSLAMNSPAFATSYSWHETYDKNECIRLNGNMVCNPGKGDETFRYDAGVASLEFQFALGFSYDQTGKAYRLKVSSATAIPGTVTPNIPARSVVQNEDQKCFSAHVSDTTAKTMSSVDYAKIVSDSCGNLFSSIPASGHLTDDIVYEFAVGDSVLAYPADDGVTVGVTGTVTYKGAEYPGTKPADLPVPAPPADTDQRDLRIYVSDYEVNALHWAYFKAGLLNVLVRPADLPDPDILKVKTYVSLIAALKPYATSAMTARVMPRSAPEAVFQDVWILTATVMTRLKEKLPASVYQQITGLEGDAYVSPHDLTEDLIAAGVAESWFDTIVSCAKSIGMAVEQNLEFTLTIQNGAPEQPVIIFDVKRRDVLQSLGFGRSGAAQTLTYAFTRVDSLATFVSSTVPKFPAGDTFGAVVWPVAGEPKYAEALQRMGQGAGVPLPIMSGFSFRFNDADLSIQEGYLSITAALDFTT